MANYETVIITRQDVSESHNNSMIDEFISILTNEGGEISRREYWGSRTLSHRIRKNRRGHYNLINYSVIASAKDELERLMGLHNDVLRFMTIRTIDLPTEASIMMRENEAPSYVNRNHQSRTDTGYRPKVVSSSDNA